MMEFAETCACGAAISFSWGRGAVPEILMKRIEMWRASHLHEMGITIKEARSNATEWNLPVPGDEEATS